MPLQENLNVAPYYADYTPLSDYYNILFKAGFPDAAEPERAIHVSVHESR